jgi:hypothetical protein
MSFWRVFFTLIPWTAEALPIFIGPPIFIGLFDSDRPHRFRSASPIFIGLTDFHRPHRFRSASPIPTGCTLSRTTIALVRHPAEPLLDKNKTFTQEVKCTFSVYQAEQKSVGASDRPIKRAAGLWSCCPGGFLNDLPYPTIMADGASGAVQAAGRTLFRRSEEAL